MRSHDLTLVEEENETLFIRVGNLSLQTRFKALRGSSKEKTQREQYLLAVSLDCDGNG